MTRRHTGCLVYGGPTRSERWSVGGAVALVTLGTDRSMCGREAGMGEIPEAEWPDMDATTRTPGLCPRCWAEWKRQTVNHNNKEAERMDATCYLCNLPVPQAAKGYPNEHPECKAEAARLDLATELHAEDIPGHLADMATLEAEWPVSPEYRAFRALVAP